MKLLIGALLLANLIASIAIFNKMGRRIELTLTQEACYRVTTPNPDQVDLRTN